MHNYVEYLNEKRPLTMIFLFSLLVCDLILIIPALFIKLEIYIIFIFNVFVLSVFLTLIPELKKTKTEKETAKKIVDSIKKGKSFIKQGAISELESSRISRRTLIKGEYNICVESFYYFGKNFKIAVNNYQTSNEKYLKRFESIFLFNFLYK